MAKCPQYLSTPKPGLDFVTMFTGFLSAPHGHRPDLRGVVDLMEGSFCFSCKTEDLATTSLIEFIHVHSDPPIYSCINCVLVLNLDVSS